jgi:hypothetical protein
MRFKPQPPTNFRKGEDISHHQSGSVTNLHTLSDQYHWALWNTHHIKLTFVTPTNKLSSFLLIFELFSLIFYWKGTYMRCWESPGDLPLVIEIVVSFRSFRCAPLAKRHKISITRGRNTHHIKLTFVTPTNKLSSFLLIFELFSLIFYWKYSILLHETLHTWNMTWPICDD